MNTMKIRLISFISLIALLASLTVAFVPTGNVLAGSNGQHIYFACGSVSPGVAQMDIAIIKGYNQQNQYVTWQGPAYWANSGRTTTYITTPGWWWIGTVRIYWWQAKTNHWYSALYTIPKSQWGTDYVYLTCKYNA